MLNKNNLAILDLVCHNDAFFNICNYLLKCSYLYPSVYNRFGRYQFGLKPLEFYSSSFCSFYILAEICR